MENTFQASNVEIFLLQSLLSNNRNSNKLNNDLLLNDYNEFNHDDYDDQEKIKFDFVRCSREFGEPISQKESLLFKKGHNPDLLKVTQLISILNL